MYESCIETNIISLYIDEYQMYESGNNVLQEAFQCGCHATTCYYQLIHVK